MSKKHLALVAGTIATLVLMGAGCNQNNDANTKDEAVAPTPTTQTSVTTPTSPVKVFTMNAKNWQFDPATITVNKGDTVRLKITGSDAVHSFMLKDYNLNVKIEPGQTQIVEFVADKAGEFSFRCGVPCGEGHREMTGKLIVK